MSFTQSRSYEFTERGDRIGWVKGIDNKQHLTVFIENGRILDYPGKSLKTGMQKIADIHQGDFRLTANQNLIIAGVAEQDKAEIEKIAREHGLIDDGVSKSYPSFIPFPDDSGFSAENPMRIGYSVPQVSGVMNAYRNNYTLIPSAITIDPTHARTAEPVKDESANLIIAGMNVLNYFNGDGLGNGYPTARGASSVEAFEMQSAKIVAALQAIDADIIGLMLSLIHI